MIVPLSQEKWTDVFGPTAGVLLDLKERRVKELIITMTESMSRGAAMTFSSLCIATKKKKMYEIRGVVYVCLYVHEGVGTFICVFKT